MMNVSAGQRVFEVYTLPHEETDVLKIVVSVYNSNDDVLAEHTFENVPVTRNKITQYTGEFLGGNSRTGSSFNLTANDEWEGKDNYTF